MNEKAKSTNPIVNALRKSNMTAIGAVLVIMIIIASISSPYFLDIYNLQSVIRDLAFVGMIGVAQSLLLLIGELDLSVGKIASLCGILSGMMMVTYGMNPWLSLVIALLCGLLFGCINGLIITKLRLNSMVATIGMQGLYGGINLVGLRRRGFSNEAISEISEIYKLIYNSGLNVSDACARIRETIAPGENRDKILSFIEKSGRGIIR